MGIDIMIMAGLLWLFECADDAAHPVKLLPLLMQPTNIIQGSRSCIYKASCILQRLKTVNELCTKVVFSFQAVFAEQCSVNP